MIMTELLALKERYETVEKRVREACERSGRDRSEVLLLSVTKTHPVETLKEAYALGMRHCGENKVQELVAKAEELPNDIHWHMIGHLQRNKVKMIAGKVDLIHSVDTLRLAQTIEKEGAKIDTIIPILIEVNMSKEESKFGVFAEDTLALVKEIAKLPHVAVQGLMTSAPNVEDPELNRPVFKNLRNLAVDIDSQNLDNVNMNVLSMGMTNDFTVAIEEGATIVRVGTAIFGHRDYK